MSKRPKVPRRGRARARPAMSYTVGYGRPPVKSQFKPGKSGNPRGRPKGTRSVSAVIRDVIDQRIAVTENGKTRRLPALEVMLRRLANDAMRNDQRALKFFLTLVDRYSDPAEVTQPLEDLLAEDAAILERFVPKSTMEAVLSPAKRKKRHVSQESHS